MEDNRSLTRQLVWLLVAFFLMGLALLVFAGKDFAQYGDIETWKTIEAKVVEVTVGEVDNPDYITYRDNSGNKRAVDPSVRRRVYTIALTYQFTLDGESYTGTGGWGDAYASWGEASSVATPDSVEVYYRPKSPELNDMLHPEVLRKSSLVATIVGLALVVGTSLIGFFWYRISHSDWEPDLSQYSRLEFSDDDEPDESETGGLEVREE